MMRRYRLTGGIDKPIEMAETCSQDCMKLFVTTDAKYLEVGLTGKKDNVDFLLSLLLANENIQPEECCFWGDEFVGFADNIFGSDRNMVTEASRKADFFDASDIDGTRPSCVNRVGGGVPAFIQFLEGQAAQ